ncbi:MAG: hypothetical protein PHV32_09015 [Eubacteriales bacterium]|nr:hypothetical protein [Eubacteriales bacterium]
MGIIGGEILKSKYDNYHYWKNFVKNGKSDDPFATDPITEESVFFHGVIINCRGESYKRWLHFPNNEALLGFLNYVFVSMAFFSFLSNETELLIQGDIDEMLDIMIDSEKCSQKDLIPEMREFSSQIRELWNCDGGKCFDELKKFLVKYNERWNKGLELFSYIDVFKSPLELGEFIIDSYENSEQTDISMIEDQLGVTKDEWLNICNTVYENDFIKRKFTEILNNRIKDML